MTNESGRVSWLEGSKSKSNERFAYKDRLLCGFSENLNELRGSNLNCHRLKSGPVWITGSTESLRTRVDHPIFWNFEKFKSKV